MFNFTQMDSNRQLSNLSNQSPPLEKEKQISSSKSNRSNNSQNIAGHNISITDLNFFQEISNYFWNKIKELEEYFSCNSSRKIEAATIGNSATQTEADTIETEKVYRKEALENSAKFHKKIKKGLKKMAKSNGGETGTISKTKEIAVVIKPDRREEVMKELQVKSKLPENIEKTTINKIEITDAEKKADKSMEVRKEADLAISKIDKEFSANIEKSQETKKEEEPEPIFTLKEKKVSKNEIIAYESAKVAKNEQDKQDLAETKEEIKEELQKAQNENKISVKTKKANFKVVSKEVSPTQKVIIRKTLKEFDKIKRKRLQANQPRKKLTAKIATSSHKKSPSKVKTNSQATLAFKNAKAVKPAHQFPPEWDKVPRTPARKSKAAEVYRYKHEKKYPTANDMRNMPEDKLKEMEEEAAAARLEILNRKEITETTVKLLTGETIKVNTKEDIEAIEEAKKRSEQKIPSTLQKIRRALGL